MTVELDLAILAAVRTGRGGALMLDELWSVALAADANLAGALDARERLGQSLERLAAKALIRLPARTDRRAWEPGMPPLPRRVRRVTDRVELGPRGVRRDVGAYREDLAGAATLDLRADEIVTLDAVNNWLGVRDPHGPLLPSRERSLEVFGDEKRLDGLLASRLFERGVLSLALLRTFTAAPPFHATVVGPAPVLLIVENHHTYHSLVRAARDADRGVGVVGYGMGEAITASIGYAAELPAAHGRQPFEQIMYWGDLDGKGLRIARQADERAQLVGLPAVTPATVLYTAHYRLAKWVPAPRATPATGDDLAWLAPPADVTRHLVERERSAQEAVNYVALCELPRWR